MGAVKPAIVPGIDRTCKNQGGKGKALCGKSDDEDEGDGVHGGVSPILFWYFSRVSGSTTASEQAKPASEPRRFDPAGLRVGDPEPRIRIEAGRLVECSHSVCPGVNLGEDVVAFVGGDLEVFSGEAEVVDFVEVFSGEAEVVDFAGGVVDFEADVPYCHSTRLHPNVGDSACCLIPTG